MFAAVNSGGLFANDVSRRPGDACMHDGSNKRYYYVTIASHNPSRMAAHNFAVPGRLGRPYTKICLSFRKSGGKSEQNFVHFSNC